tara:strand:- start:42 stop:1622 length:1581 start_codon:yes stop_codon:yes gene_type:complete
MAFKPNLRLSSAVLGGLARPDFAQDAGKAIGQAMLGPENRRKERDKMARMDASITAFRQAGAAAQQGDLSALTGQIDVLQTQAREAETVEEKLFYLNQMRNLQGQIPGATQVKKDKSVDALLRTDAELADTEALRKRINDSNAANGLPPISEADFKRLTDTLTTRRSRMLEDPDVSTEYRTRKAEDLATRLETEKMESIAWIAQNGDGIKQAIRSGSQEELDAALKNVPPEYQAQVDSFVSSQIEAEEQLQDFRSNSILKTQEPINKDFSSRIEDLSASGLNTAGLEALNKQYMEVLDKHWDGSSWDDLANKDRAAKLEESIIQTIERQSNTISLTTWQRQQEDKAREQAAIEEAKESIDTYRPNRLDVQNRAEELAAIAGELGAGEKLSDLPGEDRAKYLDDARAELIDENARLQTSRIRDIDVSETPPDMMRAVTQKQADRISEFTSEEQRLILEEYAAEEGMVDIDEIIDDLLEFEDIQKPVPPKKAPEEKPSGEKGTFKFRVPEKTADLLRFFGTRVVEKDE